MFDFDEIEDIMLIEEMIEEEEDAIEIRNYRKKRKPKKSVWLEEEAGDFADEDYQDTC